MEVLGGRDVWLLFITGIATTWEWIVKCHAPAMLYSKEPTGQEAG
jgi:hypothetical protein